MSGVGKIEINSTSTSTADVTPVVLRPGTLTRLVFKPILVKNEQDEAASVSGELTYQKKLKSDEWEDVDSINLQTLKAGENVRIALKSGEVLKMYQCLSALYEHMRANGVEYGTKHLIPIEESSGLSAVLEMIAGFPDQDAIMGVLDWLKNRDVGAVATALGANEGTLVSHLAVATGVARLRAFVQEAEENLANPEESFWQDLLVRNSWALGQLYSYPVVILQDQAYLGGKAVDSRGGNVADFLYKNDLTDNALIVEIKTPTARLTGDRTYRNNAYACTKELAGAVQQVLQDLSTLRASYGALHQDREPEFRIFSPRLLLVIGNLAHEGDIDRKRSFELFRNGLHEVDIVTFDELVAKAKLLLALFEEAF
ncbi:Shedu immune nuclease family protein [Lentzea albida]|uniref:DUF4263 domain-containing protein n=1 Tax=Lentzea albida TaxID=65499 RepID=A0A1H9BRD6_9PSEU|nr:Shedu immune nuclease family protein [Lentzea albida]SEP91367.1 protein of unknown function [Lentzea albida]